MEYHRITDLDFSTGSYRGSCPILDGTVFTDYPRRLFRSGQFKKVPVIVGAVSNETLANGASIPEALKSYFPELTDAEIDDLVALYPASDFVSTDQQTRTALGDPSVRCPRTILGEAVSAIDKAWAYRYNQVSLANPPGDTAVEHASENYMMFEGTSTGLTERQRSRG